MTHFRSPVAVILTLILLATVGNIYGNLHDASRTNGVVGKLSKVQGELLANSRKSTATRIVTVTQRCELTKLILDVLVRQDPSVAGAFASSYAGCEKQLVEVKAINAQAQR